MERLVIPGKIPVELKAPPFLTEGQNFYDQPPFSAILSELCQGYGGRKGSSIGRLRRLLTDISLIDQATHVHEGQLYMDRLTQELEKYPRWKEYVSTQRDPDFYNRDGSYTRRKATTHTPHPTYIKWINDSRLIGLKGALPGSELVFSL